MDNENINKEELPYLIKITQRVVEDYRTLVKGNEDESYITIRKKLTRNWLIGEYVNSTSEFEIRRYGNLHMRKDRYDDRIVGIFNAKGRKLPFNVNMEDKRSLDILYGLDQENNNTYEAEIKDNDKENTYIAEAVDNTKFMKMLINYTEKFGQAFKNLRG